jgi:hypothetical protein
MYGVASRAQGTAVRMSSLVTLGGDEAWADFAAWVVVFPGDGRVTADPAVPGSYPRPPPRPVAGGPVAGLTRVP